MTQLKSLRRLGGRTIASAAILIGAVTVGHAATPSIAAGHYYTTQKIISLTATGGATAKTCAAYYLTKGELVTSITKVTVASGAYTFDVRGTEYLSSLGISRQTLQPVASSNLLKQSGTITAYSNGTVQAQFPYKATLTILDPEAFLARITVDAPSPTGGTCVQVVSDTFILTDGN